MYEIKGKYTTAKIMIDDVEESCISQIVAMVNHPSFTQPISIMPDTHAGKGSVVGFTMPIGDSIIPNIIGVDIGCGVLSFNAGKRVFEKLSMKELDIAIRAKIPFGSEVRANSDNRMRDTKAKLEVMFKRLNDQIRRFTLAFNEKYGLHCSPLPVTMDSFETLANVVGCGRTVTALGTLGGGNHFIEIGKSVESGDYWITIHSGSRNFGKCVAEYHQKVAVDALYKPSVSKDAYIKEVKKKFKQSLWGSEIAKYDALYKVDSSYVPKGMEALTGQNMYNYLVDMMIAQEYAILNRRIMAQVIYGILDCPGEGAVDQIESVHNFVNHDDWIIRKGAIESYEGVRMLVPYNMKDGILVCTGKSNADWNCSAPHGAGRIYSRSQAKKTLNKDEVRKQMDGIFTTCIPLDEAPGAYKDPAIIEACIAPTVDIIDRIVPVMNLKSGEGD
jgi:tRNA-splicing ligase RtcB